MAALHVLQWWILARKAGEGMGGERAGCTKYALKQTCVKALSNSLKQKTARTTFPFATARNSITRKSVSQFTFTRYCTNFLPLILVFCISLLCPFRYNNKQDTIGKWAPLQCKQPNFKPIILRPHRHGYRAAVFILAVHRWHAPDGIWNWSNRQQQNRMAERQSTKQCHPFNDRRAVALFWGKAVQRAVLFQLRVCNMVHFRPAVPRYCLHLPVEQQPCSLFYWAHTLPYPFIYHLLFGGICTDRTAHFSYGFSSYGPHSCSLRYAGINSVVLWAITLLFFFFFRIMYL